MIDLHAHVLPGIDDGPSTWEESLLMCRQAVEDGITTLVATPHITPGVYANTRESIAAGVEELRGRLDAAGIPLVIVPSAEVWLDPDLLLDGDAVIPYLGDGGGRRFVLIHVPPRVVLDSVCDLVHTLASRGVTPIVSHPERHREFQKEPEQLRALVAAGALSQVTAASVVGQVRPVLGRRGAALPGARSGARHRLRCPLPRPPAAGAVGRCGGGGRGGGRGAGPLPRE